MAGLTNRAKYNLLDIIFRGASPPANFYMALCTAANTPTADTNTLSELTQIATGNGYSDGGMSIARNSTDFDTLSEVDASDISSVQLKDLVWTAGSGGYLPTSGSGARWAVLTGPHATVGSREVWAFWDLVTPRSVSAGQTLTLQNCEIDGTE